MPHGNNTPNPIPAADAGHKARMLALALRTQYSRQTQEVSQ